MVFCCNTILKLSITTPSLPTSKLMTFNQLRQLLIQSKGIHWTSHRFFVPPNITNPTLFLQIKDWLYSSPTLFWIYYCMGHSIQAIVSKKNYKHHLSLTNSTLYASSGGSIKKLKVISMYMGFTLQTIYFSLWP